MPPAAMNLGTVPPTGAPVDPARALIVARARKLLAEAKRAERAERRQAGELIEASTLREYASQFSMLVRDHALAQADRLANLLAAVTDVAEVHRLIREDNHRMLAKLAKATSGCDLNINSTAISAGATVSISSMTYQATK